MYFTILCTNHEKRRDAPTLSAEILMNFQKLYACSTDFVSYMLLNIEILWNFYRAKESGKYYFQFLSKGSCNSHFHNRNPSLNLDVRQTHNKIPKKGKIFSLFYNDYFYGMLLTIRNLNFLLDNLSQLLYIYISLYKFSGNF